jgi:peptide/nickel transport system ATP-binding protein
MYAGRVVEQGLADDVIGAPLHPYTQGLIGSVPSHNQRGQRLMQIPGMTPSLLNLPAGCAFQARCSYAAPECCDDPKFIEPAPGRSVRCCKPLIGITAR